MSNNNLDDFEVQEIELRIKKAYDEWKKTGGGWKKAYDEWKKLTPKN